MSRERKRRILLKFLLGQKKARRAETNFEFKTSQQVSKETTFQNGDTESSNTGSKNRRLVSGSRPVRCLHAHFDSKVTQKISPFQSGRKSLPIQGVPIRTVLSSEDLHENTGSNSSQIETGRSTCVPILGRLAYPCSYQTIGNESHKIDSRSTQEMWFSGEREQVPLDTSKGPGVYWGQVPNRQKSSIPARGETRESIGISKRVRKQQSDVSKRVPETTGIDGGMHSSSQICETIHEASPNVPIVLLASQFQRSGENDTHKSNPVGSLEVVAEQTEFSSRSPVGGTGRAGDTSNRRVRFVGLGSPHRKPGNTRDLDRVPEELAYKQKGIASSGGSLQIFCRRFEGKTCIDKVRQHNSGQLHKQTRRDQITSTLHANMGVVPVGNITRDIPESHPSGGLSEQSGGQTEQTGSSWQRVGSETISSSSPVQEMGRANDRSICDHGKSQSESILFEKCRTRSGAGRCPNDVMGQYPGICLPANSPDTQSPGQGKSTQVHSNSGDSLLAEKVVATENTGSVSRLPSSPTSDTRPTLSVGRDSMAPRPREAEIDGMENQRQKFRQEGFSEEVINTMCSSIRSSTSQCYNRQWRVFHNWCSKRGVAAGSAPLSMVLAFLQMLVNKKTAYRTLGVYRSAISKFHEGINGIPVGQLDRVGKFMKGAFIKNPPTKNLLPSWDLQLVLKMLRGPPFEPLRLCPLKWLTLKTVFLVAIVSARRCSEIQALGRVCPYFRKEATGVRVRPVPGFLSKTATPWHLGQDILLPEFRQVKALCVKRSIMEYIKRTKDKIGEEEIHLFVAHGGKCKYKAVTKRTISGWLVKLIKKAYSLAGKAMPVVKAHSTRGTRSSWALFNGASIIDIMKAADWRSKSSFANHYGLDLWKQREGKFGKMVLQKGK